MHVCFHLPDRLTCVHLHLVLYLYGYMCRLQVLNMKRNSVFQPLQMYHVKQTNFPYLHMFHLQGLHMSGIEEHIVGGKQSILVRN